MPRECSCPVRAPKWAATADGDDFRIPQTVALDDKNGITMAEKTIIIGSGPAAWTAAIYAARAELHPLVFEGAVTEENRLAGTLPMGQLNLTTEVENFPGFPYGDLDAYFDSAVAPEQRQMMAPHGKHGISGPELMTLMRQQAVSFQTRVITEDVVSVDFARRPFALTASDGKTYEAISAIVATGRGRTTWASPPRTDSRTAASAPAPSATAPCRGSATDPWPSSAAAIPPSKRPTTSPSSPASCISSTAAISCGRRRSWPTGR